MYNAKKHDVYKNILSVKNLSETKGISGCMERQTSGMKMCYKKLHLRKYLLKYKH